MKFGEKSTFCPPNSLPTAGPEALAFNELTNDIVIGEDSGVDETEEGEDSESSSESGDSRR